MFRKKQQDPNNREPTRPQFSASVFSYYSSRSARSGERQSKDAADTSKRPVNRWFRLLPSILALIIIVSCIFYATSLSNQPKIQINRSSNTQLLRSAEFYQHAASKIMSSSVFNRSKLIIDTDKFAKQLESEYPELGKVSVIIPLISHRPIVVVQPAEPVMVLSTKNGNYIVDEQGRALIKAEAAKSSLRDNLLEATDESGIVADQSKQLLPLNTVKFIGEVYGQLIASNQSIKTLTFPPVTNEVHVRTEGRPYYLKFDLQGDPRQQVGAYLAASEKLETDKITPSEYIDVRVPEKVFYK